MGLRLIDRHGLIAEIDVWDNQNAHRILLQTGIVLLDQLMTHSI